MFENITYFLKISVITKCVKVYRWKVEKMVKQNKKKYNMSSKLLFIMKGVIVYIEIKLKQI